MAIVLARDAEFVELDRESVIRTGSRWRVWFRGAIEEAMEESGSGVVWGIRSPSVLGRGHCAVETAFHSLA